MFVAQISFLEEAFWGRVCQSLKGGLRVLGKYIVLRGWSEVGEIWKFCLGFWVCDYFLVNENIFIYFFRKVVEIWKKLI